MKTLTACQVSGQEWKESESHRWNLYRITHSLLRKKVKSGKRTIRDTTKPSVRITHILLSQLDYSGMHNHEKMHGWI